MRRFWFAVTAVLMLMSAIVFGSSAENVSIRGDYVEVRTASVFAGACHYNGEVTTTGRDALMAWNITAGKWNGVDLAGVRAVAIVTSEGNLSDNGASRRSEIIIDRNASHSQAVAMLDVLKTRYVGALGKIVAVDIAPISFDHMGGSYTVTAGRLASINVEAMPNDLCCKMPTSIVNQTIESPVTRDGSFDQLLNLFDLGNVATNEVGLAWSSFIHFGGERSAGAFAFRTKDHLRTGGYEGTHAAFSYATAAAGDDDYFVGVAHLIRPSASKKQGGESTNVTHRLVVPVLLLQVAIHRLRFRAHRAKRP